MTAQTPRKYSSRSQQTTLSSTLIDTATVASVNSATTLLGGVTISAGQTFTIVIDPDTSLEEIVDITAVSGNNITITRAVDGSTAQDHSAGAVVRHMVIGRDLREANTHEVATMGVHGLGNTSAVVGTQDTQTLYNKTLISPILTSTAEADSGISFEGSTVDSNQTFLGVVDPTQDNTITLPNTSGTVILDSATQTLTNKTLTSPTIGGTPVITGLSSAGMSTSSATPKSYVDAILGSATAASTSAASAATSASSALVSQTAAATSATSAAASATAAATSAASAATSATSAATYLSSVQTSATSAANSATAAAASATTAANSVATITTSAASAATSATSAAASATLAASYTSAAATSAASAATSASSAAASAASMTASVAAAATSATSAAASATAAATSANSAATSATSAAASATSASGYANSASISATGAGGAYSGAAAQATAAATSATSAAASATAASTSATSAAASATAAATSATSSASSFTSIDQKYLGAKSSPPTLNNQGGALATGAEYWNSSNNTMYVWNGTAWTVITATANITMYRYTATGGETSKSGADDNSATLAYAVGFEQVYVNGVLLVRNVDYTASTGSSITGLTALVAGDVLVVLAFTAFSVANAVPLSTYTAKGDLALGTGASTVGTLNVGADGSTLVANSSAGGGVSWSGPSFLAGRNKILNGDFAIAQRGTTFSNPASASYTLDRWLIGYDGSGATRTVSQQVMTPGNSPTGYESGTFLRIATTAAGTGNTYVLMQQRIEDVRVFAGQTITYSFWIRSSTTTSFGGSNMYQNFGSGGSGAVGFTPIGSATISSNWTRVYGTYTIPSISGKTIGTGSYLEIDINLAGGVNTFDIWGVQLEAGSVATPFTTATGTLQGELAACQRYYWRQGGDQPYQILGSGYVTGSTNAFIIVKHPVTMRVAPSGTIDWSNVAFSAFGADQTPSTIAFQPNGSGKDQSELAFGGSGFSGTVVWAYTKGTTSGYLGFSAEL